MTTILDLYYQGEEKNLIIRAYRGMLKSIQSEITADDVKAIREAFEMAADSHKEQRRKSGEPYILHPIAVAHICAEEIGLGPTAIIGALLHDVVEDTDVSVKDIREKFGDKIGVIVDGLTKLDNIYDLKLPQAENFKKILMTLSQDVRVCLIKLADRLHNMRTLESMPTHKQLKIASETSYVYAPLAHRLGLYAIKTELQDLCMKVLEPDNYHTIARKLKDTKKNRTQYIDDFLTPIKEDLDSMGVPYRISGRPKSISSIYNKIVTKRVPFEEIYDLFAVRIILDVIPKLEKRKCWEAYSIITDYYQPIPERLKDWISHPKANGYESLHTTVMGHGGRFIEVQIRTERMDEISERGFAAHWKYKGVNTQDNIFDRWLTSVRETLEEHQTMDSPEFMSDFKSNLFSDEVYVFTPNGEMKLLPKGATALDFAFDIHSDIGYHCVAIKVNNKMVALNYELNNGDQLTIMTSKNQKPSESWLSMCTTGKAKSKIRSAMREERKKKGELGKEALERKLHNAFKVKFDDYNIDFLVKHFGLKTRIDLYYAIYVEDVNLQRDLKDLIVENGKLAYQQPIEKAKDADLSKVEKPLHALEFETKNKPKETKNGVLYINGEDASQLQYQLATCCNPVNGDSVFCYTNSMNEMKVHKLNCQNAHNLLMNYGYRVLKAEWGKTSSIFTTIIQVSGSDRKGLTSSITDILLKQYNVNMRDIHLKALEGGLFRGELTIDVENKVQLEQIIESIKEVAGVHDVNRTLNTE